MGANPSMLSRRSDISPQELRNNEKRILQLDCICGSVVVIVVNQSLVRKQSTRPPAALEALHIRKRKSRPAISTSDEFRSAITPDGTAKFRHTHKTMIKG